MKKIILTKKTTAEKFYKSALKSMKWLATNSNIKFNYLAGINRAINPAQVTKLAKSLEKMLILRPVVIAELSFLNGKIGKYIVDGQHIFNALIRLGWEIPYVTIKVDSKQDLIEKIALLNASSKTWTMQDYVVAWSFLKADYVKLNHYFQVYDFEITQLASILSGNITIGGNVTRILKSGEFKVVNEEKNIQILNNITDMLKIVPRMNRFENRYAITEYVRFVRSTSTYNHKLFLESLEKNKNKFILATQEGGKLAELFQTFIISKN
jgi:hypothetical protein